MDASMRSLGELFGKKDVVYEVPSFQRPYVWDKDEQWEPLWRDVSETADTYLSALDTNGPGVGSEQNADKHFMGAVVLQKKPTRLLETETAIVIDGQQRLITLQLLLSAATEVLRSRNLSPTSKKLSQTVHNSLYDTSSPKMRPTAKDRAAFDLVMSGSWGSFPELRTSQVVKAYEFFKGRLEEWVDAEGTDRLSRRSDVIAATLLGLLKIAVVDLEEDESAYEIFESLNARGTPLLPSDLVKNYIMEQASDKTSGDTGLEQKCNSQWSSRFDKEWWSNGEVRFGNEVRNRLNQFLHCWIAMKTANPRVKSSKMLPEFKRIHTDSGAGILQTTEEFVAAADTYSRFDPQYHDGRLKEFFARWGPLEAYVMNPLVLWVMTRPPDEMSAADKEHALAALESYLVRRAICRLPSNRYSDLTRVLLPKLTDHYADQNPAAVIVDFLRAYESTTTAVWPSDDMLVAAAAREPVGRAKQKRTKMILASIENHIRAAVRAEGDIGVGQELTLEHIMPVKWSKNWQPIKEPHETDNLVQTIGNLTLLTADSNSKLSNESWDLKRAALEEGRSVLQLNRGPSGICNEEQWTEDSITARSESLAQTAAHIWPGPQDSHWNRTPRK